MTAGDNWCELKWIRRLIHQYVLVLHNFCNLGLFLTNSPHHSKDTVIRANGAEGTELDQKKRSVRVYPWIFPL